MGLFDKFKGKTDKKSETSDQPKYQEDWDTYFSNIDNIMGSIMVDLGLSKIAPIPDKPNVVWVSIIMQKPREDGFSSSEECDLLYDIEDNLVDSLVKKYNAIYIGRLTSNGKRDLYFYFGDTAFYDQAISQSMVKYPTYKFDYGTKEDKTWDGYLNFLYPMPDQFQMIMNARVIRNLEKNGDNLNTERMVDHWVYFKNDMDVKNYISEVENLNFKILSKNIKETADEFKYEINIGRIDKVDYHSVNEYVLDLWELARKNNGSYDGWGCTVVKD